MLLRNLLVLFRYTLVITISNVLTSIFAGFVIFAYMGYLAYITGQQVQNVVSEGKEFCSMHFSKNQFNM